MIDQRVMDIHGPLSRIEHDPRGPTSKEVQIMWDRYFEIKEFIYTWWVSFVLGATLLVFMFYVTYHVISKVRGNEKNKKLNNL